MAFRLLRKEALRQTIEGIHAALQGLRPVAAPLPQGATVGLQQGPLPMHVRTGVMKEL